MVVELPGGRAFEPLLQILAAARDPPAARRRCRGEPGLRGPRAPCRCACDRPASTSSHVWPSCQAISSSPRGPQAGVEDDPADNRRAALAREHLPQARQPGPRPLGGTASSAVGPSSSASTRSRRSATSAASSSFVIGSSFLGNLRRPQASPRGRLPAATPSPPPLARPRASMPSRRRTTTRSLAPPWPIARSPEAGERPHAGRVSLLDPERSEPRCDGRVGHRPGQLPRHDPGRLLTERLSGARLTEHSREARGPTHARGARRRTRAACPSRGSGERGQGRRAPLPAPPRSARPVARRVRLAPGRVVRPACGSARRPSRRDRCPPGPAAPRRSERRRRRALRRRAAQPSRANARGRDESRR